MNIFDCAIKMETEAGKHYEKLAAGASVPELKQLFSLLAAAEAEHLQALTKAKQRIDAETAAFSALKDAACVFRPLLGKRDLMEELENDPDAYRHVVKEEEESIEFYVKLADSTDNEETKALLLALAEEEKRHLSIIENIYSFLEAPRTYLAWGEFSNLQEY